MERKFLAVLVGAALIFSLGACKKKEDKPVPQSPMTSPNIVMPQGAPEVVLPDSVKGKWAAVKIAVEDKAAKKSTDVVIKLNSEYVIPGSNLKIAVGDFVPDFKMEGNTITSVSGEPNMPAVRIKVYDGDKELFKGWLFSKMPAIHPFQHEKYGLLLKEGVKKG